MGSQYAYKCEVQGESCEIMPSRVESEEEFTVGADKDEVMNFFLNLKNIGSCIPGCESVTILDNGTALFRVKLKVGYISRTFELKAKFKDTSSPERISFVGEGVDAEIAGDLGIIPRTDCTLIKYRIEIRPVSVVGKTALTMLGKDLVKQQASEFAKCVKSRLDVKTLKES